MRLLAAAVLALSTAAPLAGQDRTLRLEDGDSIQVVTHHVLRENRERYERWMTQSFWEPARTYAKKNREYAAALRDRFRFVPLTEATDSLLTYVYLYPRPLPEVKADTLTGLPAVARLTGRPDSWILAQRDSARALLVQGSSQRLVEREYGE